MDADHTGYDHRIAVDLTPTEHAKPWRTTAQSNVLHITDDDGVAHWMTSWPT